jgi:D-alanyl-lipoteichoic acid acyltransferase DltB (MBOAT superfamily)
VRDPDDGDGLPREGTRRAREVVLVRTRWSSRTLLRALFHIYRLHKACIFFFHVCILWFVCFHCGCMPWVHFYLVSCNEIRKMQSKMYDENTLTKLKYPVTIESNVEYHNMRRPRVIIVLLTH